MAYKLLLADDSVTIQRVIELTFADEDVQVISVGDGAQAMDRIPHERPDIVLADVGMPQHDGYEVARFIKSDPSLAHIPVLLLTGAFEPVDEPRARAAGCDGVLAKPFEPQMLIARVKELLSGGSQAPQPAAERAAPARPAASPSASAAASHAPAAPAASHGQVREPGSVSPAPDPGKPAQAGSSLSLDEYFDKLDAAFANLSSTLPSEEDAPTQIGQMKADWSPTVGTPVPVKSGLDPAHLDVDLSKWMQPRTAPAPPPAVPQVTPAPPPGEPADPPTLVTMTPPASLAPVAGTHAPVAPPDQSATVPVSPTALDSTIRVTAPPSEAPTVTEPAPILDGTRLVAQVPEPALGDAFTAFLASEQGESLPPAVAQSFAPPVTVSDELVEDVTRRVLARLSDRVLKDTVADIVSQVAERVVREEIDRLKASLR
jgi:CheY-like chemotaxis protein